MKAILDGFEITHEETIIDLCHKSTFFAFNAFRMGKTVKRLDARPSDSIALALRTGAKIYVHKDVLKIFGGPTPSELKKKIRKREMDWPYFLPVGDKASFTVKSNGKFVWESSDPTIAFVTQAGLVRGLKKGKAVIRASVSGV